MKVAPLAAATLLAGCAAATVPPPPAALPAIALRNAGFEDAPRDICPREWHCVMHAGASSHRYTTPESQGASGRRGLCIERVLPEPWGVATQVVQVPAVLGAAVRLSVAVRTDGVDGDGAGPWMVVQNGSGVIIAHAKQLVKRTSGWQRVSVDLEVPREALFLEVGGSLEGGGRACFDDFRLELVRPAAS